MSLRLVGYPPLGIQIQSAFNNFLCSGVAKMSFDALTIGGIVLALLAAGLLIGIVRGNDKASEVRRRLVKSETLH